MQESVGVSVTNTTEMEVVVAAIQCDWQVRLRDVEECCSAGKRVMGKHDIGLIGAGVMGQNLALNLERHGYWVAVYDDARDRVRQYVNGKAAGRKVVGTESPADLTARLNRPRLVLMMVPGGDAVDECIASLLGNLEN